MEISLLDHGYLPKRQTKGAAGFDIYSPVKGKLINQFDKLEIKTGIVISNKLKYQIYGRSGLAVKFGICIENYEEKENKELIITLQLLGEKEFKFEEKERIAQLVLLE